MTGPNMETFGARQARRFHERKGYARESMHFYRPGPETIGKWVTKMQPNMTAHGPAFVPVRKRVTEPFSTFKANMRRWYLNLNADHRRCVKVINVAHIPGCWYSKNNWAPRSGRWGAA